MDATMKLGENGCAEYTDAGVGSDVLAISQILRGGSPEILFRKILDRKETKELVQAIVLIFTTRNTRGGKGEKDLSFKMYLELMDHGEYAATTKALLPMFVHFGCWKDLFLLLAMELKRKGFTPKENKRKRDTQKGDDSKAKNAAIAKESFLLGPVTDLVHEQWMEDLSALAEFKAELQNLKDQEGEKSDKYRSRKAKGPSISLLAKWLPREDSDLDRRTGFVKHFSEIVSPSTSNRPDVSVDDSWKSVASSRYRKQVTELTSFLHLPEVLLAAKRADEINFACVASKATYKLTKAFLNQRNREDPKRTKCKNNFILHMSQKGLKGGQVMPHEIVKAVRRNRHDMSEELEKALDAQWKDLWADLWRKAKESQDDNNNSGVEPLLMSPICDVSGSMEGIPMEVAIAMSIGIAEKSSHPAFANRILTFESNPTWVEIDPNSTIVEKVKLVADAPWGGSTNLAKAFDRLLGRCIKFEVPRSELPSLIIFSDMQFDSACGSGGYKQETMWQTIQKKMAKAAARLGWSDDDDVHPPPVIFWNLRNTGGHPVTKDEQGTVLLSGFSPSLLKSVVSGDILEETEVEVVETSTDGIVTTRSEKARVTPEEVLIKILDDPMYDSVRQVLGESTEGALLEYESLVKTEPNAGEDKSETLPIGDGYEMI